MKPKTSTNNSLFRGVLAISSGTLAGQIIVAAITPLLSRLYPPEAHGQFATILAIASILGPAAALKFDSAVRLPLEDSEAKGIFHLGLLSVSSVSLITGIALYFLGPIAFQDVWNAVPGASVWVAAQLFSTGIFSLVVHTALRAENYGLVGWRATIQAAATSAIQVSTGFLSPSSFGLLAGAVVGRLAGLGALIRSIRAVLISNRSKSFTDLFRKYWRNPVVLAPSSILNAAGSQLPLIVIALIFGAAAAGQMTMAQRLVFLPAALLGSALAHVFGAEFARRLRESKSATSRKLYINASLKLAPISILVCVIILIFAPAAFSWVLGESWEVSGSLAQAMALSSSVGLIASPLSSVYSVYQSAASLMVDASRVLLLAASVALIFQFNLGLVTSIWLIYAGQVINYLITWSYGLRIVSRGDAR